MQNNNDAANTLLMLTDDGTALRTLQATNFIAAQFDCTYIVPSNSERLADWKLTWVKEAGYYLTTELMNINTPQYFATILADSAVFNGHYQLAAECAECLGISDIYNQLVDILELRMNHNLDS